MRAEPIPQTLSSSSAPSAQKASSRARLTIAAATLALIMSMAAGWPWSAPAAEAAPGQSSLSEAPAPAQESGQGQDSGWEGFGNGLWPNAGWQPYGPNSPFNLSVAGDAVHPESPTIVNRVLQWGPPSNAVLGVAGTPEDWMHPVYFAVPGDPIYALHATEPWGDDSIEGMRIPIPPNAQPAGGSDGHMAVITPNGWEYDFWQVSSKPAGGGTMTFSWGGRLRIGGSGLGGEATTADFGLLAGVIRPQELKSGRIDHALFVVLKCTSNNTSFGYGTQEHAPSDAGGSFVYPASKGGSRCSGESEAGLPPMGARFSLAMSNRQIEALNVPRWKKAILHALARYGGYVGDTGGPGFALQLESGSSYTSQGLPDPWVTFAREHGLPTWNGRYILNLAAGVEWGRYLRVLTPPSS